MITKCASKQLLFQGGGGRTFKTEEFRVISNSQNACAGSTAESYEPNLEVQVL